MTDILSALGCCATAFQGWGQHELQRPRSHSAFCLQLPGMGPNPSTLLRSLSSSLASTSQPRCHAICRAGSTKTGQELWGVRPENRKEVAAVLDKVDRAVASWSIVPTDFLTPPGSRSGRAGTPCWLVTGLCALLLDGKSLWQRLWWGRPTHDACACAVYTDALAALGPLADVQGVPWGGYASAERQRLLLGREEVLDGIDLAESDSVIALQVRAHACCARVSLPGAASGEQRALRSAHPRASCIAASFSYDRVTP